MLSHPRSAHIARDAIRVFSRGELEDQVQMCLIDFRDTSRERTCIDDKLHTLPRCLHGGIADRVPEAEMVDDDVHAADLIAAAFRPARVTVRLRGSVCLGPLPAWLSSCRS